MIKEFVKLFNEKKEVLKNDFSYKHPEDYEEIVKKVISILNDGSYSYPDSERIHVINDGDYQGTLLFVIAATGYQPSDYWYVKVSYGSCSGCDTLEAIKQYAGEEDKPTKSQVKDYMTLALHIIQGLKKMEE
jgi:hypothetical protein